MIEVKFSPNIDLDDHSENSPIWGYIFPVPGISMNWHREVWMRKPDGTWVEPEQKNARVIWHQGNFATEWGEFILIPHT